METARRCRSRRPRRDLASTPHLISLVCWSLLATTAVPATAGPPDPHPIAFRDVAAEAGVIFRFENGSRGRHDLPEIMGGGVALIDGDGDGWLDIYLCDGGPIVAGAGRADPPCRYYRNNRDGTFADETVAAGAPGPSYAMGASVGDFDGDGRDDLFVTGWRDQRLYRNRGGGRFEDVTRRAGVNSSAWSTSAAFADLDGDGDLDLYVANYLDYDPGVAPFCSAPDGRRDYCGPEDFPAQRDRLYRNNGDGTFADVSREAGIVLEGDDGRGLGVLIADLAGDPRPDIFVANDGTPCLLFENRGGLRFAEVGHAAGVARDGRGEAPAGMGVALGDLDDDGRPDLVVTNFLGRGTIAFLARGGGAYLDASAALGLIAATRDVLGFGLALADFDADGRLDLIQANGHVLDRARLGVPFAMRTTLLRNQGGRLAAAPGGGGPWFARPILGRGLAVGDLDRDGRPDVVINALDAPAAILRNVSTAGLSLALDLVGRGTRRAAGARVRASVAGRVLVRDVVAGGSYLSSSECRIYLGLGDAPRVDRLEVTWPSGRVESWADLPAGGTARIVEGTGTPSGARPGR
jgi:enediyne biosynthesis protein E4